MAREEKTISELTNLPSVNRSEDLIPVVDVSDTTDSAYGTTKKTLVSEFIGDTGPTGDTGVGTKGDTGVDGGQGDTGIGEKGDTGSDGDQGDTGVGEKGDTGEQGLVGSTGVQGSTGVGEKGDTGNSGAKGDTGVGEKGDTGNKGDTGADSTVAGPKGDTGVQGDTGAGEKGDTGDQGDTGVGVKGDTGVGEKGDTGIGQKGDTGQDGDTGVGDQGDTGQKGDTGTGQKGDTGSQGDTGPNSVTTATTTNLTGYLYGDGSNVGTKGTQDGWIPAGETWTYASADAPTFTFTVAADVTAKYSAGMRIKLTQTTVKYFIITAVSTFSGGNTTITVYGGTDYDLANAAISSNFYSTQKAPQGFPLDPDKWSVETIDSNSRTQDSPTANVWYNLGSVSLSVPIGVWNVSYSVNSFITNTTAAALIGYTTLSTGNNSETDINMTSMTRGNSVIYVSSSLHREKYLNISSKTLYYLNMKSLTAISQIAFQGNLGSTVIRATCAYL